MMNSIASSVRCRVLRRSLESNFFRRKSLHLSPQKNHSMACVRFASTKNKSGILSRLKNMFNRTSDERTSMSPRIRSVMDLAPRSTQSPIREPNMPEKRDRKDEKDEKNERKDKKPVLKTETNEEPAYKYQWGVRVPDDIPESRDVEKTLNYVVTHKWGVNMSKYREPEVPPIIENPSTEISANPNNQTPLEMIDTKVESPEPIFQINQSKIENWHSTAATRESPKTGIAKAQVEEPSSGVVESEMENLSSSASNLESPQTLPLNDQEMLPKNPQTAVTSGVDLTSGTPVPGDDDYNVPIEIPHGSEISAWRDVVVRSRLHEEELANRAALEASGDLDDSIFIRPEPPQPKLDVQVVGTAGDVVNVEQNVAKSSSLGSTATGINLASATKKFHTCCVGCRRFPGYCHRSTTVNWLSTTSVVGKEFQSLPPDSEDPSGIETDATKQVQAQQETHDVPKFDEDMSSVLQDLSQREMEVLLSYTQHSSDEAGNCPTLPTSVTISTFPPGSKENVTEYPQQMGDGNEIFNVDSDNANAEITELERTILKLKGSDEKEDGKSIKDKKGNKDDDYIRIPGDPYPYSREHYEKWRVPHGKCPIVNDDVPKAKPAETSDSPRSKSATSTTTYVQTNSMKPAKYSWSSMIRRENNGNSLESKRVTTVGAEQPTVRVQTIHPNIEPPKRDVVDDLTPKDQASKFVENLQSIDVKTSTAIAAENTSEDLETIKQRRRKGPFFNLSPAGDDKVEASRVYELKNYAYIRPDYIKDTRGPLLTAGYKKKLND